MSALNFSDYDFSGKYSSVNTPRVKPLVKLAKVNFDDVNTKIGLEDMLLYDGGKLVSEDFTKKELVVELTNCTIARWESFGFDLTILNRLDSKEYGEEASFWTIKGDTKKETKEFEEKTFEYDKFEKNNIANGYCADGCCGGTEE